LLTTRVANSEDLPQILELEKRNGRPNREDFRTLFRLDNPNEKCVFFVAEDEGKVVGYSRVHFYKWNNSAYIITVLVDAEHRRKGIGTRLLKTMKKAARERKARVLMFDVAHDNAAALQLFFKDGFRVCGYNDKSYSNGKTAIYLAKELQ